MIATDAIYHINCLTDLFNRARTKRNEIEINASNFDNSLISTAFAELAAYVDECRMDPERAPVFVLVDLAKLYSSRLNELGENLTSRINTTRLKEKSLGAFPDLRAQSNGRNILMMFDQDIAHAIDKACEQDFDSDALWLMKAARIIRDDIFNIERLFNGSFVTAAALTLSQLLVYNSVKHNRSNATSSV